MITLHKELSYLSVVEFNIFLVDYYHIPCFKFYLKDPFIVQSEVTHLNEKKIRTLIKMSIIGLSNLRKILCSWVISLQIHKMHGKHFPIQHDVQKLMLGQRAIFQTPLMQTAVSVDGLRQATEIQPFLLRRLRQDQYANVAAQVKRQEWPGKDGEAAANQTFKHI